MSSGEAGHVYASGIAGGVNDGLIVEVGLVLVAGLEEGHEVGLEGFLALPLDGQPGLVRQQNGVFAVDHVGALPDVVPVLVIDLGQRERLPINLNGVSGLFPDLCQPHVGIVDKGSTEIVVACELSLGHFLPPAGIVGLAAIADGAGRPSLNCSHALIRCQSRRRRRQGLSIIPSP